MAAKILIIEDDKDLAEIYSKKLEGSGFSISVVNDGQNGLVKTQSWKPDLILLDLMLPQMHGFDVLAKLKESAKTKKIPVIILTNLNHILDEKKGYELGVADYLIKVQTDVRKLPEIIKKHLQKAVKK